MRWLRILGAVSVLAAGAAACSSQAPAPRGKVLLIGLDGAEWDIIDPLVEAGEMPNFARLMENGVYGKLRSLEPAAKSPAIWTTIATGKSPDAHGITTFVDEENGQPLTRNIRRVRALWNIGRPAEAREAWSVGARIRHSPHGARAATLLAEHGPGGAASVESSPSS